MVIISSLVSLFNDKQTVDFLLFFSNFLLEEGELTPNKQASVI